MRKRSITYSSVHDLRLDRVTSSFEPVSGNFFVPPYESVLQTGSEKFVTGHSVIVDDLSPRYIDRPAGFNKLVRAVGLNTRNFGKPFEVHPCSHAITRALSTNTKYTIITQSRHFAGEWFQYVDSGSVAAFLAYYLPPLVGSHDSRDWFQYLYSSVVPPLDGHNWYSLYTQYEEACNSFIPSKFLLGEDIYQNAIFIDALKLVINPSRAILTLLSMAKKLSNSWKRKTLGEIARQSAKQGSNSFLFYNFGLKPAIKDIFDAFKAHRRVEARLNFLRANQGSWVRIGVKDVQSSDISGTVPTQPYMTWYSTTESYKSSARIGCMGKVRNDIHYTDAWRAYAQYFGLQHVVGLAWELIPFSFVIDWFTNTQEFIRKNSSLSLGSPFTHLRGLTCSTKVEQEGKFYFKPGFHPTIGDGFVYFPNAPTEWSSYTIRRYERSLRIPDSSGLLTFSGLGLFQILASGALLLQRRL